MEMSKDFKQTEIGRIPKEWEVIRLGEVFSLEYGKGLTEKERENGEFPVYGSNGVVDYHSQYIVKGPGVIVGRKGSVGAVAWADKNFWPIDTTYYISLKKSEIDLRWLFYKLLSLNLARLNMATGTPGLNRELVYKVKISLPPLPEQKKIAEILSTVDTAIEKVGEAIAKTERIKKGLMQELLTKGIGHKEFKDTEIGRIPKEWEVVKVGKIGNVITGTTPSTKVKEYWGEGYLFVTPTDFSNNKYVYKTERSVTQRGVEKARIIPKDSVMVTCIASIGEIAMSSEECITNQQINSIVCGEKANPHYVYYVMKFRKNVLKKWAGITTSPIVKKSLFEEFPLPLPPLPEQQKIAEILSTVNKRLELLRNKKEKLTRIKKGLMNDLLTGKKRVKV